MKPILFSSFLAIASCLIFASDLSAQDSKSPYAPESESVLAVQNAYYAEGTVFFHQKDGSILRKKFSDLSARQKANLPSPLPPGQRSQLSSREPLLPGSEIHVTSAGRVYIIPPGGND